MVERLKPQQIDIEVSSLCNLRCKLCPINDEGGRGCLMSFEDFSRIVRRVAEESPQTTVVPWLNGEPLLHPRYAEMLALLNRLGLRYYVTTNGTLWRDEVFHELLRPESSAYQLLFSLDGLPYGPSRSIELARPGSDRAVILDTINRFLDLREQMDAAERLDVAIKICERGQDHQEIEEFIQFWLSRPTISYVAVGKALNTINEESLRLYPCQYSDHKFMVVKSDCSVVPCSYNLDATSGRFINFGTYRGETSLLDFYNNDVYTAFREDQRNGRFPYPCDKCGFAYTGSGVRGIVEFEHGLLAGRKVFYRSDYYNSFYSLRERRKSKDFYKPTEVSR